MNEGKGTEWILRGKQQAVFITQDEEEIDDSGHYAKQTDFMDISHKPYSLKTWKLNK